MKKLVLIFGLLTFVMTSCGDKKKEDVKDLETTTQEATAPEKSDEAISNDIVVEANDNMKYNVKTITVNGGQKVRITLKHVGVMTKDVMGHNLVILKQGVNLNDFAQKSNSAADTDYIPADSADQIVVATKMIGGGEEVTIEFDAPAAGSYDFLCTFPAHYAMMRGKFIVK